MSDGMDRATEMALIVRVVEDGSFSAAARTLRLTPSGVSRANRPARGAARRAAADPHHAHDRAHGGRRELLSCGPPDPAGFGRDRAGGGRPGVTARPPADQRRFELWRLFIVPLLRDFLALYPDILVDISLSDTVIDLTEGRADVAIRIGPLPDSGLMARRLGDSGRSVVASPDYVRRNGRPATPDDLLRHNCIGFNFRRTRAGWPFRRDGREIELAVTGTIEANNGDAVAQLARDGVGIARVGTFHVAEDIAAGRLVELLSEFNPGDREPFHGLFVGGTTTPARVRVFIDYLAERLHH